MSPEAQRIAIAEALGWIYTGSTHLKGSVWNNWCPPKGVRAKAVPNYVNSLDAIHEAEGLVIQDFGIYYGFLTQVCGYAYPICAPAPSRAEALLKTLNLWTEAQP